MRSSAAYIMSSSAYDQFLEADWQKTIDVKVFQKFAHTVMLPCMAYQLTHDDYVRADKVGLSGHHRRRLGQSENTVMKNYEDFANRCVWGNDVGARVQLWHSKGYLREANRHSDF